MKKRRAVIKCDFGRRKLYFLRLMRLCKILLSVKNCGLHQQWLGHHCYALLSTPEDFRSVQKSQKLRIFCAMWHILSKHRFLEAAQLLAHAIHSYPLPACWIWRVAFHIFRCLNATENFARFNQVLDQFRLADENNRILERTLFHLVQGDLEFAHKCRNQKVTPRDRYTSSESIITREPEFDQVQRLQHLYEGLSFYGLWLRQLHSSHSQDNDDDMQCAADELAEKAFYRLQGVEALITTGYTCDIFIRPLVELLEYFNEPRRARSLLVKYSRNLPTNPNAIRYLCEWYKRRSRESERVSDTQPSLDLTQVSETHGDPDQSGQSALTPKPMSKIGQRLLRYRVKFSKFVLPEPAPVCPSEPLSSAAERELLRSEHPHMTTIVSCLKHGLIQDAFELSLAVLDHPSWARFKEPWKLLYKSISALGKQSPEVVDALTCRKRSWMAIQFTYCNASTAAAEKVHRIMASLPDTSFHFTGSADDLLGPLLTVQASPAPPPPQQQQSTEISELDTSI